MTPAEVALIAAGAALIGALGSQIIAGWVALKTKRLEFYLGARGDAYQKLLECTGDFALAPGDQAKYLEFLAAYEVALLFASDDVLEAIDGKEGINVNAARLRQAAAGVNVAGPLSRVQATTWKDAMDRLSATMRADLRQLGGGRG